MKPLHKRVPTHKWTCLFHSDLTPPQPLPLDKYIPIRDVFHYARIIYKDVQTAMKHKKVALSLFTTPYLLEVTEQFPLIYRTQNQTFTAASTSLKSPPPTN